MNEQRHSYRHLLSWAVSVGLFVAPVISAHGVFAQQANPAGSQQNQPASGQQGDWGPAGPPPDAQNGQVPPPPQAEPQSQSDQGDWNQDGAPPPPPGTAQARQPYGQQAVPGQPYYNQPSVAPRPTTIAAGTLMQIRTSEPLDAKKLQPGDYFQGTVAQSIFQGNYIVIPRGAQVVGQVVAVKKPGDLKGSSGFSLQLTSLNLGGQSYPLATDAWSMNGPGKGGYTAHNTVGTAALGAVIGAIAGGGPGAAVGAVAGTGIGLGASAATSGPRGVVPPESVIAFHIVKPLLVQPISAQEAQQLEQNSPPPQPRSYRARYPYPPPASYYPGAYPYPYAYPYGVPYPYVYGYPYGRYYHYRYWR